MRISYIGLLSSLIAALAVSACGKDIAEFQKDGQPRTAMLKDDEFCWAKARKIKGTMSESEKTANVVGGAVLMGPVGLIVSAAGNADADNPRSAYYVPERNRCMREKGYSIGWAP